MFIIINTKMINHNIKNFLCKLIMKTILKMLYIINLIILFIIGQIANQEIRFGQILVYILTLLNSNNYLKIQIIKQIDQLNIVLYQMIFQIKQTIIKVLMIKLVIDTYKH